MKLKLERRPRYEDNMRAMIDVVFLLLIYFLCTAQFGILELDFNADLSQGTIKQQQQLQKDFDALRIYVMQHGGYSCNGHQYADIHALGERLKDLRALHDARIIIDADADVTFQHIMLVMDQVKALSFSNISFAGRQ